VGQATLKLDNGETSRSRWKAIANRDSAIAYPCQFVYLFIDSSPNRPKANPQMMGFAFARLHGQQYSSR
jgi:hypothetical protein